MEPKTVLVLLSKESTQQITCKLHLTTANAFGFRGFVRRSFPLLSASLINL